MLDVTHEFFDSFIVIWSVGVNDLISCKTLLKVSVKYPPFLLHVMLSALSNRRQQSPLLGIDTDTGTDFKIPISGIQTQTMDRQGLQEDTGIVR